ncbi:hypothetical protein PVAND_006077 [Polypedilum vanderplanki]|uniref:Uncharacterized protein n=1 Tax=Polypedilum vanderplanki TaxID=319348 RepID=A0A9J6C221_POLVA|nr:hypothetical protein PVAND_006077 [Polypedilum vanderplanki]
MLKFATILIISIAIIAIKAEDDDENTLKCLVGHLKSRGVQEDFFDSVSTQFNTQVDCPALINAKLSRAYSKIESKLKADNYFGKYANCVMENLKRNDDNTVIMLRREAIKLNGLGIAVWNYFNQKEYLDKLKKRVEDNINTVAQQKCIMVN